MVVVSSTFSVPAEGILFQTPATKLFINDKEVGSATLYITKNNVTWGGGTSIGGGESPTVTLLYPSISLHAIQREPSPALYMVLNYELRLPSLQSQTDEQQNDDDEDFDADDQPITQLRFLPLNEADLSPMYTAMNEGQSLHPDPSDDMSDQFMDGEEDDGDEEEFEDAEDANGVAEDAASRLRQMQLDNSNGAEYEDCDEEAE